jgi:PPOX class probable F420-dependent enzyme
MVQLTDRVKEFLQPPRFAVLATINRDGTSQQTPIWFELRGDRIMMNTRVGVVKERNIRRDPRVSICVVDGYRYVTIKGTAELVYDRERAQADIRALAIRYHGQEAGERRWREYFSKLERVSIYVTIEHVVAANLE